MILNYQRESCVLKLATRFKMSLSVVEGIQKAGNSYKNSGCAKIVLKADQQTFDELLECSYKKFIVTDAGKTECLEGTITAIGFEPMYDSEIPEIIKSLKLL